MRTGRPHVLNASIRAGFLAGEGAGTPKYAATRAAATAYRSYARDRQCSSRSGSAARISASPAHHAVARELGAGSDQRRPAGLRSISPHGPASLQRRTPSRSRCGSRAPIPGRRAPIVPFLDRRKRRQPTHPAGIPRLSDHPTYTLPSQSGRNPTAAGPTTASILPLPRKAGLYEAQIAARGTPQPARSG